jgi:hypothetical protein
MISLLLYKINFEKLDLKEDKYEDTFENYQDDEKFGVNN